MMFMGLSEEIPQQENQYNRIDHLDGLIELEYGDLLDVSCLKDY